MTMRQIYRKIARENGVKEAEVKRDMQAAIDHVENWKDYLNTAARLYKYSFDDICAGRPNASACAFIEQWNGKMNELTYTKNGDYLILDLLIDVEDKTEEMLLDKYGMLWPRLLEIDQTTRVKKGRTDQ